jgi:hypothetical protein
MRRREHFDEAKPGGSGTSLNEAIRGPRRGRRIYDEAVREALMVLWEASDRVCGKRLRPLVPILVEAMERHGHLQLEAEVRTGLFAMSAATIDRALREKRGLPERGRRKRNAPSAIRRSVTVRTFAGWDDPPPGYVEADLVAHSGPLAKGHLIQTLTVTDIASGWTECGNTRRVIRHRRFELADRGFDCWAAWGKVAEISKVYIPCAPNSWRMLVCRLCRARRGKARDQGSFIRLGFRFSIRERVLLTRGSNIIWCRPWPHDRLSRVKFRANQLHTKCTKSLDSVVITNLVPDKSPPWRANQLHYGYGRVLLFHLEPALRILVLMQPEPRSVFGLPDFLSLVCNQLHYDAPATIARACHGSSLNSSSSIGHSCGTGSGG